MTVEVPDTDGYRNGDLKSENTNTNAGSRKSKENERRRRRRKQKKNNKVSREEDIETANADEANGGADDTDKENSDLQKVVPD